MLRKLIAGVALTGALLVPLAGCGNDSSDASGGSSPSASPTPKPAEVLAAAVTKTAAGSFKVKLIDVGGGNKELGSGAYDTATKNATLTATEEGESMQMVIINDKMYLSGPADFQGKTIRVQIAKIPASSDFAVFTDPAFALALLPVAADVLMTSPGSYSGTVDLAKVQAQGAGTKKFVESATAAAGAKANAVTFQAVVDAQGYLSKLTFTFPGWGESKADARLEADFSGFGEPVKVTEPTGAKVIEAPADFYTSIG